MCPGILPKHGFKHKGNYYATLPWFGTKLAQKYVKRDHRTCAVTSRKKFHVSGCRRQAGDVNNNNNNN